MMSLIANTVPKTIKIPQKIIIAMSRGYIGKFLFTFNETLHTEGVAASVVEPIDPTSWTIKPTFGTARVKRVKNATSSTRRSIQ
mmetsp:Transcript_2245/g.2923  ORF Transcript_2245/g.2923 Transcript_2245/m.2923 type:complete len:84 (-) Transcript_2245:258-509(-)